MDWTKITSGKGDRGSTKNATGLSQRKSDLAIWCLSLLEEAQIELGFCAANTSLTIFQAHDGLQLEQDFRDIMGSLSAWQDLHTYVEKFPDARLPETAILQLDATIKNAGTVLNQEKVKAGWVNYTTLSTAALQIARFNIAVRKAECALWRFIDHTKNGYITEDNLRSEFELEARYLNRLSKLTHLAMVWQAHIDQKSKCK